MLSTELAPPPGRHPETAHLVVEVSVSTIRHDTSKAAFYTAAHVAEYWIVDVGARVVRVHRDPRPDGFGSLTALGESDMLQSLLPAPALAVADLIGP